MVMRNKNYGPALTIVTTLFFMWGFITVMNDVLINTFEGIFNLSAFKTSMIQMCFFGAFFIISLIYFIISSTTGKDPINKIGYKNGISLSLLICGIGSMAFFPAAYANSYYIFLIALFILATGVTLLQICANPYAALLGKPETASSRLNLAQGLNSLGTTIGPLVGVLLIFRLFSNGEATVESVGKTYLIYGGIFILLSILIRFTKLPSFINEEKIEPGFSVLKNRHLLFGIIAIFFYVGAEVSIGSWLVKLLQVPKIGGLEKEAANYFLSYYWGGLMIGRLLGSISLSDKTKIKKYIGMALTSILIFGFIYVITSLKKDSGNFYFEFLSLQNISLFLAFIAINYIGFIIGGSLASKSLALFSFIIIVLLLVVAFGQGEISFWSVISIGLFNSIMWSNIFTLAIKGLGKLTGQGSSLLVMAIVGGAIIPPLQSLVIDNHGVQISYLVPIFSYLYLAFYGLYGYKQKSKSENELIISN